MSQHLRSTIPLPSIPKMNIRRIQMNATNHAMLRGIANSSLGTLIRCEKQNNTRKHNRKVVDFEETILPSPLSAFLAQ